MANNILRTGLYYVHLADVCTAASETSLVAPHPVFSVMPSASSSAPVSSFVWVVWGSKEGAGFPPESEQEETDTD